MSGLCRHSGAHWRLVVERGERSNDAKQRTSFGQSESRPAYQAPLIGGLPGQKDRPGALFWDVVPLRIQDGILLDRRWHGWGSKGGLQMVSNMDPDFGQIHFWNLALQINRLLSPAGRPSV